MLTEISKEFHFNFYITKICQKCYEMLKMLKPIINDEINKTMVLIKSTKNVHVITFLNENSLGVA